MIIGTAQLGLNYGATNKKGKIDKNESQKILSFLIKKKIFKFDTAFGYGDAHKRLSSWVEKIDSKKIEITTKINLKYIKNYKYLEKKILNLKKIFKHGKLNLLCHDQEILYKKNLKFFNNLKILKSKKIVNQIGVSVYSLSLAKKALKNKKFDIIQIASNLLDQRIRTRSILKFKKKIFCRSIFLQGILITKNYKKIDNKFIKKIKKINNICEKNNISIIDLCFYYILKIIKIKKFIVGFRSRKELEILYKSYRKVINMKYKSILANNIKKLNTINPKIIDPRQW